MKTVLHVGCGPANPERLHETFRGEGWKELRLDINPEMQPDVVASITDMQGVGDDSVDAIWSSHNLEHLFAHEVSLALAEFYRVLKPGGLALVTMPDAQSIAAVVAEGRLEDPLYEVDSGPICAIDILWGHRGAIAGGNHFMAHRTGFTAETLRRHFENAGFRCGRIEARDYALWIVAHKP